MSQNHRKSLGRSVASLFIIVSAATTGQAVLAEVESKQSSPGANAAPLVLESVEVDPVEPNLGSPRELRVRLRNKGKQPVAYFSFTVHFNGKEVSTYGNHVFFQLVGPDTAAEIKLFSLCVTESDLPAARDGELSLDLLLQKAHWVEVKHDGNTTVYSTLGSVEGLPLRIQRTIPIGTVEHR